uniref:Uncharacterized protein n=1 Tax=Amphimedon queenslandica TaxID=400682 RepID=A0A1X7TL14_AMPQE
MVKLVYGEMAGSELGTRLPLRKAALSARNKIRQYYADTIIQDNLFEDLLNQNCIAAEFEGRVGQVTNRGIEM